MSAREKTAATSSQPRHDALRRQSLAICPRAPWLRGSPGEAYLALGNGRRIPGAGCAFRRDLVFVLDPDATPGIVRVDRGGRSSRFAEPPRGPSLPESRSTSSAPSATACSSPRSRQGRRRSPRSTAGAVPVSSQLAPCMSKVGRRRTAELRPLRRQAHSSGRGDRPDLRLRGSRARSPRGRVGTSCRRGQRGRVGRLRPAEARSPRRRVPRGYGGPGLADDRVGQPADPRGHGIVARTCTRAS
jgi:hypothetical protein